MNDLSFSTAGACPHAEFTEECEILIEKARGAATGFNRPADRIEAHCLFNLAAARGAREALRLRQEIAAEMTPAEIALAQRRARFLLDQHMQNGG